MFTEVKCQGPILEHHNQLAQMSRKSTKNVTTKFLSALKSTVILALKSTALFCSYGPSYDNILGLLLYFFLNNENNF
jgi:hypothetical protein